MSSPVHNICGCSGEFSRASPAGLILIQYIVAPHHTIVIVLERTCRLRSAAKRTIVMYFSRRWHRRTSHRNNQVQLLTDFPSLCAIERAAPPPPRRVFRCVLSIIQYLSRSSFCRSSSTSGATASLPKGRTQGVLMQAILCFPRAQTGGNLARQE